MKILISGSSGFVGKNLIAYLLHQQQIEIQDLSLRKASWKNDIDSEASALIHLAGKAHDTSNTSTPEEYFKVNTEITKKLFDEFLNSEIRDFFYFSSVKASADTIDTVLDEQHHSDPKTPYGKSKLLAEEYLLSKQLPNNKRLFIIRPCMIHGPGNKGNLNLLYKLVQKGMPWPLAAFENKRSFLCIDNLNFLIENMVKKEDIPSGIYNFADDDAISTSELVKIISQALGKKERLLSIPTWLVSGLAKIGDKIKLPLNSERLKKLTENYIVSNQKVKQAIGVTSLPVTIEEGLEKTIKSFNTQKQ